MKHLLIFLAAACFSVNIYAQSAEDSVRAVINRMFEAMRNSDAVALRSCFGDSVVFQTITRSKEGKTEVRNESVTGFSEFVAAQPKGSLDERITFETIKIDRVLAQVWTPYQFYFNGQFSHCGVNSFQLVRFHDGWKIQYIIDTRRKDGCL
jgi:hypothetical protein